MKVFNKNGNEVNLTTLSDVNAKMVTIDCNIALKESNRFTELINMDLIICCLHNGSFYLTVTDFEGYSLMTYAHLSVGVIYRKATGEVVFQYNSTPEDPFKIIKIVGFKLATSTS